MAKIHFTVRKGEEAGAVFSHAGDGALMAGRHEECDISLPDATISRHHCLIEIGGGQITVRDCHSLNGTFLNGENIGQGKGGKPRGATDWQTGPGHTMKCGDILGLGNDCNLLLEIKYPECDICGNTIPDGEDTAAICEVCRADPVKVLEYLMAKAERE